MEFPRIQYGRRTNRRFDYKPRFYDEGKEDLDERVDRARKERDGLNGEQDFEQRIRYAYQRRDLTPSSAVDNARVISRLRVLAIATILGLLFYLLFYTDVIYVIFEAFDNARQDPSSY